MHETPDRAFPLERPANIAVLASGRGSNLEALIHGLDNTLGRITLVITNNPQALVLERASRAGIRAEVVPWKKGGAEFEGQSIHLLEEAKIDLICLAGFMRVLSPNFVRHFAGRVLNIHPSLLPSFPGLAAQSQAIEARAQESGCTVHFVDEGVDTGPIVLQRRVAILPEDTADTLAKRILVEEHTAYPAAVHLVLKGLASFKNMIQGSEDQLRTSSESRPSQFEHSQPEHESATRTDHPTTAGQRR